MRPRLTFFNLAIILGALMIVLSPFLIPREISRWYLAAAANAYRLKDRLMAEQYLAKAVAWDANLVNDADYWIAQLSNTHNTNSDEQLDLLEKAIRIDARCRQQAQFMAERLVQESDFQRAVRALKLAFPDGKPQRAADMNELAYIRSLAGIELDQALADIEKALELQSNDPLQALGTTSERAASRCGMLDTQAWVLHGMRRDLEALPIIREAVEGMDKVLGDIKPEVEAPTAATDETFDASFWGNVVDIHGRIEAAKKRLGPNQWTMAVLHFHYLRILEALRQSEEVQRERQWLLQRGVPIVDELF
jgi:tetratricopeptide (TPR) repeat protein